MLHRFVGVSVQGELRWKGSHDSQICYNTFDVIALSLKTSETLPKSNWRTDFTGRKWDLSINLSSREKLRSRGYQWETKPVNDTCIIFINMLKYCANTKRINKSRTYCNYSKYSILSLLWAKGMMLINTTQFLLSLNVCSIFIIM